MFSMKHRSAFLPLLSLCWILLDPVSARAESETQLREPWDRAYAGEHAAGKSVVALWSFDGKTPTADQSGHGHDGRIEGAKISPDGRFGACLESSCGYPVVDKRHAMVVKNSPELSPAGAFTMEMWLRPGERTTDWPGAVLLDKKYVAYGHKDYMLSIESVKSKPWLCRFKMELGFGTRSVRWYSGSSSTDSPPDGGANRAQAASRGETGIYRSATDSAATIEDSPAGSTKSGFPTACWNSAPSASSVRSGAASLFGWRRPPGCNSL